MSAKKYPNTHYMFKYYITKVEGGSGLDLAVRNLEKLANVILESSLKSTETEVSSECLSYFLDCVLYNRFISFDPIFHPN